MSLQVRKCVTVTKLPDLASRSSRGLAVPQRWQDSSFSIWDNGSSPLAWPQATSVCMPQRQLYLFPISYTGTHFPPSHSSCTSATDTEGGLWPKAQGLTFQKFYQVPWHLQEFNLTSLHLLMTKYVNQENLSDTIQHSLSGSRKGQNDSTHQWSTRAEEGQRGTRREKCVSLPGSCASKERGKNYRQESEVAPLPSMPGGKHCPVANTMDLLLLCREPCGTINSFSDPLLHFHFPQFYITEVTSNRECSLSPWKSTSWEVNWDQEEAWDFHIYFQLRRVWTLWRMFHFSVLTFDLNKLS